MSLARRTLQALALICTFIVGAASMAVIVTQTTWFKEWLRGFIVRQAEDYVNGRLSIGRLDGNLFFGIEMEDIDITQNGKTVVDIKDAGLDYNPWSFVRGHAIIDTIRLNQPVMHLERTVDGWNLTQLIKARTPDPDQPKTRPAIEIGEIGVSDGTMFVDTRPVGTSGVVGTSGELDVPTRVDKLDLSVGVTSDEKELKVTINHVSFRAADPGLGVNDLSGVVRRTENVLTLENVSLRTEATSLRVTGSIANIEGQVPRVELSASADKFDIQEFAGIIPALRGYLLQPAFEVTARGPVDQMQVDLNVRETNLGNVIGRLTVDAEAPGRRVAGNVTMTHFNADPLIPRRDAASQKRSIAKTDITGTGTLDLALPEGRHPLSGTYTMRASHVAAVGYEARNVTARGRIDGQTVRVNASAAAYGAQATANGTVRLGQPLALDLAGRASHVDMRNLPRQLNVPGAPTDLQFAYTLTARGPVVAGDVTLDRSTVADATIAPGAVGTFRFGGGAPQYSGKGEVTGLDPQKIGRAFNVTALATDRYRGTVNGTFDVRGSGGGRYPLTLDATGTLMDSGMFGATIPRLDFTTTVGSGDVRVKAIGQFEHLDPAVVTGNARAAGDLSGAVDVNTTFRGYANGVTVDSFDAEGRVNLAHSTFAGLSIDTGIVDGSYANREGNLKQVAIDGPDLDVQGSGPIALNDTGASNLTLHIESPSLDRLGKVIDRPIKGAAIVDATVTGNARALAAQGTLKGSNLAYGNTGALSVSSAFSATLPDMAIADASVTAKTEATFVDVAGQRINVVTADTTYMQKALAFSGTAAQQQRELTAAGTLILHPDHQEVHVRDLALRTEGVEWRTAAGGEASINYGQDRVEVENVNLVSGDQRITANGTIGSPTEPLRLEARNVDVAQLDALLLGEQRVTGRFTGTAAVSGSTSAPRVAADFTLTQGTFRQFMFESFGGKVDYAGPSLTLDVKLQQNPQAWITAKGSAPVTLFRANPVGVGREHEAASAGEAVDIQVASSQIDLGLVQGFTSYVTNVTGMLQANVHVTGSGHDPHLDGAIDIKGGSFVVPTLGTAYTGLDTRIDLTSDALSITQMRVLDDHGQWLTVGGRLGVHELSVGAVDVKIASDTFEVLHNKAGSLKLDTDLRLTGELRAPKLVGSVDVHTGTLNIAELMQQATRDPYGASGSPSDPSDSAPPPPTAQLPALLDALELEIGLAMPGNLVLNGNNLRPANAPIDIGDMSVTVGGAVRIWKTPHDIVSLTGDINTVRGNYTFQGRRFEIMRDGRIRFFGGDELDPYLDIRARRVIAGIETFVRIQGTMRAPELSFTSNPPLEEADILALIVFNQPINELGEGQQVSLAQQAAGLAGGYLASGLATSIGNALSLDEFQIQAQGESGSGPQLTLGEQIGDNLFFRIRQGFGAEQATEFILEYQIKEYLRLQGTAAEAQGGTQRTTFHRIERGGLDLIFFFSF